MEAPESAIKNFAQMRKRIIEPAVAELKAKDGMDIEWAAVKSPAWNSSSTGAIRDRAAIARPTRATRAYPQGSATTGA